MGVKDTFIGNDVLFYVDTTTPLTTAGTAITAATIATSGVLVACLTENGFDGTTSPIGTSSKCSGRWATSIPGEQGWSMSASGNMINVETGEAATLKSHNALFKLWRAGTIFWGYMYNTGQKTLRYGQMRIDSDGESFPTNAQSTFTVSLVGIGEIFDQDDLAPAA